jgi:hypothetical protein
VIISTSPLHVPAAGRTQHTSSTQPLGETELSKLIRYGCRFELEVHQMKELTQMRAENIKLRLKAHKA